MSDQTVKTATWIEKFTDGQWQLTDRRGHPLTCQYPTLEDCYREYDISVSPPRRRVQLKRYASKFASSSEQSLKLVEK